MNYILFDNFRRNYLLPITFTRPVCDIRIGILTIREKWEKYLGTQISTLTEDYLSQKYPIIKEENNILINGTVSPNDELVSLIKSLKPNQTLIKDEIIIAVHVTGKELEPSSENLDEDKIDTIDEIEVEVDFLKVTYLWDIFARNDQAIRDDFEMITKGRQSEEVSSTNTIIGDDLFVEKNVKLENVCLNTTTGPVYLGEGSEIMEGSVIRGPFALCNNSIVKMASKIYGATTVGPYCKVGGELNNCVIIGHSNKAHDGFLGNSVIGEWCNLGADTNNSNLKNNYDEVKLWSYPDKTFIPTGLQFCGLIMGDHSKCGINTMFNTGTVVGVSSNIFGSGFQRNFIPSFAWGGTQGFGLFKFEKASQIIERVFDRREKVFDEVEKGIMKAIFDRTRNNTSV